MDKFVRKYKKIPQAVKASYWFMICNVFQKGLAFITIPIYTRLLTTTEYGTYSVYNTIFYIIAIFASLSLSASFFYVGVLKYDKDKDKFLSSIQGLSTISTIIVFAICFIFYGLFYKITELNIELLLIMSVQMLFSTPVLYWSAKQRFEYKYKKVVAVTLISSIATVCLSLLLINYMTDRSYSLILGAAIVQILVGVFFFIYNLGKGKCFYDRKIWKHALSFGVPLIPHYLAYIILNSSDRVMINNLYSSSAAGIYSLACQISIAVNLVTSAIDASFNPWVYQKLKARQYQEIARITNYVVSVFGMVVVGFVLVSPEILLIVAPEDYQSVKWVMPPVILGCFYLYLAGCFMRVAFYHERKQIMTVASVFSSILNILLNLIFIPTYGFIAAAYTTLISYMVFAMVHFIGMRVICKNNSYEIIPFDSKILILIALGVTVTSQALLIVYEQPIMRYGFFVVIISIAAIFRNKLYKIYSEIKRK